MLAMLDSKLVNNKKSLGHTPIGKAANANDYNK